MQVMSDINPPPTPVGAFWFGSIFSKMAAQEGQGPHPLILASAVGLLLSPAVKRSLSKRMNPELAVTRVRLLVMKLAPVVKREMSDRE